MEHKIGGVSLAKCTTEELRREWSAGLELDATGSLTPDEEERLRAIEREYSSRIDQQAD